MEQLQGMWQNIARWLPLFSSRPASVISTHYIIALDLAAALRFSAVPEAPSRSMRGATKKCLLYLSVLLMKALWHPLIDPKLPVFWPVGENLPSCVKGALWSRPGKVLIALQILPVDLTCVACRNSRDAGWLLIVKGLIP